MQKIKEISIDAYFKLGLEPGLGLGLDMVLIGTIRYTLIYYNHC